MDMLCETTISISSKKIRRLTEYHGKLWPNVRYADTLAVAFLLRESNDVPIWLYHHYYHPHSVGIAINILVAIRVDETA